VVIATKLFLMLITPSQYNTGSGATAKRIPALIAIEEEFRLRKTRNICS